MPDTFFEPDVALETPVETQTAEEPRESYEEQVAEPEPAAEEAVATAPEPTTEPTNEPAAEPATLAVSSDEFSALEERIRRAVDLVKRERQSRADAEERASQAEARLQAQIPVVDQLQSEVHALRTERDNVRQRVERLLAELDTLEL
jgi:chromosome segregation ATPase